MSETYHWIGFVMYWLCAVLGCLAVVGFLLVQIINLIGKFFDTAWVLVEFAYYKKDFLEWVKDKERINTKKNETRNSSRVANERT